jgi:hypothetical protein
VAATRTRFTTHGPAARRGTVISFRLRAGGAVVLVVRSGCVVLGQKHVRGHGGLNRVRFDGRLHGHALAPGVYRISVVVDRHGRRTTVGSVAVQVVSPGSHVSGRVPPQAAGCAAGSGTSSGSSLAAIVPVLSTSPPAGHAASPTPPVQQAGIPVPADGTPGPSLRPPTLPALGGGGGGLRGFALALFLLGGLGTLVLLGYGVLALDSRLSRKPDARG